MTKNGQRFVGWYCTTKSGLTAMWEKGGGMTNTGGATIIANPDGSKKKAIYTKTRGHLACGKHALVVVRKGDLIIKASRARAHDDEVHIYRIVDLIPREKTVGYCEGDGEVMAEYVQGGSIEAAELVLEGKLAEAVDAAIEKASCYHCRSPHYVREQ